MFIVTIAAVILAAAIIAVDIITLIKLTSITKTLIEKVAAIERRLESQSLGNRGGIHET